MNTNKKTFFSALNKISEILPAFFWVLLIFGFEEPPVALISITAAIIHECGHMSYIFLKKNNGKLRGNLSGFRIKSKGVFSYKDEMLTYIAGPLANLSTALLVVLFIPLFGETAVDTAIIHLVTAISNLLPIKGYDGYGILRCLIQKSERAEDALIFVERFSSGLIFFFCIFSLYLIDRQGGGYWIFAVFFASMIKNIKDGLGE